MAYIEKAMRCIASLIVSYCQIICTSNQSVKNILLCNSSGDMCLEMCNKQKIFKKPAIPVNETLSQYKAMLSCLCTSK